MNKSRLLTITVVALLLLNLGTLMFLFNSGHKEPQGHPRGPHGRPMPREIIIEKLHFDPDQVAEYNKLIEWHHSNIEKMEDKISMAKNELYLLLNEETINENARKTLIDSLSSYQKQIETIHFRHFQDIRKLCRKDQMDDYKDLTTTLSELFSKPKPRHPHE